MKKSSKRLLEAIKKFEKIGIFGDYDVDGASSTALLGNFFSSIKIDYEFYIPDRKKEGYGPSIQAFEEFNKKGWTLVDLKLSPNILSLLPSLIDLITRGIK